jgi:calcineurin-like phosphoesterase family protein
MVNWVISDLHLGHKSCIEKFVRPDGTPLRDFKDIDEMNKTILDRINATVAENDRLYILGDVVINSKFLPLMDEINCKKRVLVGGNHDGDYEKLQKYFTRIHGCLEYNGCILTHIPVHPMQKERFKFNLHGHLHFGQVTMEVREWEGPGKGWSQPITQVDPFYKNVSVEMVNYTPVSLDELTK